MKKRYIVKREFDSRGIIHNVIYRKWLKFFWLEIGFTYNDEFASKIIESLNELNKPRGY